MTYQLALELKNAGFPQKEEVSIPGRYVYPPEQKEPTYYSFYSQAAYEPTLSELIEVCSQYMFILTKQSEWHGGGWVAGGGTEIPNKLTIYGMERTYKEGKGDTPEESVARLWLKLNAKE